VASRLERAAQPAEHAASVPAQENKCHRAAPVVRDDPADRQESQFSSAFATLGVCARSEATLILDPERGPGTGTLAIVGDGGADAA
jgi:hypothetical protein